MFQKNQYCSIFLTAVFIFVFNSIVVAQADPNQVRTDTVPVVKQDSLAVKPDTIPVAKQDTTTASQKEDKKKSKKKGNVIIYAGANFNHLDTESGKLESSPRTGWHAGAAYKRGRFFYWQAGMMYNSAKYNLKPANDTAQTFNFNNLEIPLTAGINFLPFMSRVFNIHLFISAIPAFRLNVSDNSLVKNDNTNSFNMYGQAGLGIDVLFLVIEGGYNYGFTDLFENQKSNPGQAFVSLGVRF